MSSQLGNESFRDHIATVDESGRRRWIYPRRPSGKFYRYRTYVSYLLLAILFGLPWVRIGGEPLLLLNILERRFIIFGLHFTPQDFHLFAITMITAVVFISLFTVVFGRLFCGWVCPQTIFMEMVFRKIEYWIEGDANAQRKLDRQPNSPAKLRKKGVKHFLFLLISALIAHTFLSYIIGTEAVLGIVSQSPLEDPFGFAAIVAFILVFYFVFARMREQVCIAICPYGRLQGVLLDEDSICVSYDYVRGEPRGKISRNRPKKSSCTSCEDCRSGNSNCADRIVAHIEENVAAATATAEKGDCIDCGICVQVCPTGIDIRDGIQMECVNCTACMDACDEVMTKVDRPTGLIRYDSERGIQEGKRRLLTPRVVAYSAILFALLALNTTLLLRRNPVDIILLRAPGLLYQENQDGSYNNLYTYQIVNKSGTPRAVEFRFAEDHAGTVRLVGQPPMALPDKVTEGALFVDLPATVDETFDGAITLEVWSEGKRIETLTTNFIHPENQER